MDSDRQTCLFFGDCFFIEDEEDMLGLPEEAQADIREMNAIDVQDQDVWMAYLAAQWPGWRHTQLTRGQAFVGTYSYASPEQIAQSSTVDQRSDLYSLGVMLWEMLARLQDEIIPQLLVLTCIGIVAYPVMMGRRAGKTPGLSD